VPKETAVEKRQPSSISTVSNEGDALKDQDVGNWSCNAGDSDVELKDVPAAVKPPVKEQTWPITASAGPHKEPCPTVKNCDFDYRNPCPTGSCICLLVAGMFNSNNNNN